MSSRPAPLPSRLGTVFSRSEALALGVSTRRLTYPDVERIGRGLYRLRPPGALGAHAPGFGEEETGSAEASRLRQIHLASAHRGRLPPGVFFAGHTAAALWKLPVPIPRDGDARLEIACFSPRRASRDPMIRAREISPRLAGVRELHGLPVSDPVSTWAMIAPELEFKDGVALGDAVIRRPRIPGTQRLERPPLATIDELRDRIGSRSGAGRLRAMTDVMSPHSASPPETHLRLQLQAWGVPGLVLDHDVYDASGRLLGCSELAIPEFRIAFEYEGDHHRTKKRQWNRDIDKVQDYTRAGWETIRVTASLLYHRSARLHDLVFEALADRGWPGWPR